jgi:glycosyltransferase involved in cell wall biosynthesis
MRIALVSPLYERVPPLYYGGTERVISYLTEELVAQGHDVTLFASGDSQTSARLFSVWPKGLRLGGDCHDPCAAHILAIEKVLQQADQFDVIHSHIDYLLYPLVRRLKTTPIVTTLHLRLDHQESSLLYEEFSDVPVVSISNDQRRPLPGANWVGTVYHGLPIDLHSGREKPGKYLAFLGRISPEKRPDLAIELAIKTGVPLKIAAKIDHADQKYFDRDIKPRLDHPLIEFIGEITEQQKGDFLGNAMALVFQVDWPEPFGLVMIEAMSCGTPVIASRFGSVPEVVDEGQTGFLVNNMDEAVTAVHKSAYFDRRLCRQIFENRFTSRRMAADYVNIYTQLRAEVHAQGCGP